MNKHIASDARKRFFDSFVTYRTTAPVYRDHDCLPGILSAARMAAEGHSIVADKHQIVTALPVDKYSVIEVLAAEGFDHMEWYEHLCFFRFEGRCTTGPEMYLEYMPSSKSFKLSGEVKAVQALKERLKALFKDTHRQVDLAWDVSANQGLSTTPRTIELDLDYYQSFFPFLDKPIRQYFNEFMASKANVILLIGPPGTGKTSFTRSLIHHTKAKTLMAYNQKVIESPDLYQAVRSSEYQLLVLEDADTMVAPRTEGNTFMSELLNDTQGIANSSNMKIVISTNLSSLSKVDSALIRAGRCFAVLQFRPLSVSEANQVRDDMDMPEREFVGKSEWTLSEVINEQLTNERGIVRSVSAGFGQPAAAPRDLLAA